MSISPTKHCDFNLEDRKENNEETIQKDWDQYCIHFDNYICKKLNYVLFDLRSTMDHYNKDFQRSKRMDRYASKNFDDDFRRGSDSGYGNGNDNGKRNKFNGSNRGNHRGSFKRRNYNNRFFYNKSSRSSNNNDSNGQFDYPVPMMPSAMNSSGVIPECQECCPVPMPYGPVQWHPNFNGNVMPFVPYNYVIQTPVVIDEQSDKQSLSDDKQALLPFNGKNYLINFFNFFIISYQVQ